MVDDKIKRAREFAFSSASLYSGEEFRLILNHLQLTLAELNRKHPNSVVEDVSLAKYPYLPIKERQRGSSKVVPKGEPREDAIVNVQTITYATLHSIYLVSTIACVPWQSVVLAFAAKSGEEMDLALGLPLSEPKQPFYVIPKVTDGPNDPRMWAAYESFLVSSGERS